MCPPCHRVPTLIYSPARMKSSILLLVLLPAVLLPVSVCAASEDLQAAELKQLRSVLPPSPAFDRWLEKYGYLPPDFGSLPSTPYPQDLLTVVREGKPHTVTAAEWPERRKELAGL